MLAQSMHGTVSIVGAGRVGRTLGRVLHDVGWKVGMVVTRSPASARRAVKFIGAGQPHAGLTRKVLHSDLVLISTPDGQIADIGKQLAQMGGEEWRGKVVLHTSGALDSSPLAPIQRRGAATGSLHPLQTFSDRAIPPLDGCVFALEGSRAALRLSRRLVGSMGGVAVHVSSANKPAYHAAAAMVSGHLLALVEAATQVLMRIGFTRRQAIRALLPLLRQTLANFEQFGPAASWTGPLSRGDYGTVRRNAAALAEFLPEFGKAYTALARLGAAVLGENGAEKREQLEQALDLIEKQEEKTEKRLAAGRGA
jgi:predicted short-subunit dehydrogenase-like oxidoreductase (DUF2520 family)